MKKHIKLLTSISLALCLCFTTNYSLAQGILDKTISLDLRQRPLSDALIAISKQGGFFFSYNSSTIPGDSLVNITVQGKTIKQVLDLLLNGNFVYKEKGDHLILKPAPKKKAYIVTGQITDARTGKHLSNVSVYDREQMVSTLSDENGYFQLRLRDKSAHTAITVSKQLYADTSVLLSSLHNEPFRLMIFPSNVPDVEAPLKPVEKEPLADFFLSSKQKIQSLNLDFLVESPFQVGFTPGLNTHGKMSSQVVNTFSFNVLGSYTAGVDGFELSGLFNINKQQVQYAQLAGLFNIVGGTVKGAQVAGLYNGIQDSVTGAQVAGISNVVKGSVTGAQVGGIYNQVAGNFTGCQVGGICNNNMQNLDGAQVGGVFNYVNGYTIGSQIGGIMNLTRDSLQGSQIGGIINTAKDVDGSQIAGIVNVAREVDGSQIAGISNTATRVDGSQIAGITNISCGTVDGSQISGIFNTARTLNGVQIGLINHADTSNGVSIGLINVVKNGYNQLRLSSNESFYFNAEYKSGNKRFYSLLIARYWAPDSRKAFALGYGIGTSFALSNRFLLSPELSFQNVEQDWNWENSSFYYRFQLNAEMRLGDKFGVYAGPAFAVYHNRDNNTSIVGEHYSTIEFDKKQNVNGWIGFQAGITLF